MELELVPPVEALRPLVATFYRFRTNQDAFEGVDRVDVGQIRFHLRGRAELRLTSGETVPNFRVTAHAPWNAAPSYRVEGPFDSFGVLLQPIGWRAITGLSARPVANRVIDGEMLFGDAVQDLHARLERCESAEEMVALVTPFLLARVGAIPPAHLALADAVQRWAASDHPVIETLYADLGMSVRHATRLLNEYFGGPAKHLERKYRALRAASRIAAGAKSAEVAEDFYDQPHMIRELRRFVGLTPRALRDGVDRLAMLTLALSAWEGSPASFSIDAKGNRAQMQIGMNLSD